MSLMQVRSGLLPAAWNSFKRACRLTAPRANAETPSGARRGQLAGRPPFQAEGLPALLRRIVEDPLPALPADVPRDLAIICRKCLTKEPEGRYASAAAFAEDITRWLENRPILARPVGSLERAVRWARRNPAPALLGTALLASLTLTAGAMWREARTSRHLLEESQASEKAAREAAEASRKAEGRALESEIRARISNGPWHERDRLIATVRDSEDLRHTPADCDLLLSLSAMPSLEPQKSIPYDRGGWEPMMDAKMLRYVTLENDGCAVRDTASGKVIHHVKSKPVGNYPPGPLSADGRLLLITGFLGGLTTFSSFSGESLSFLHRGEFGWAAAHAMAHLLGALLFCAAGFRLIESLPYGR
jgi:hypothetical protein